jgi:hypothetical protein
MAQQSARRGRKNQMNPSCLEHAFMIWFRSANSHTGPQLHRCTIRGRTDGSIRLRADLLQKPLASSGASTDEFTTGRIGAPRKGWCGQVAGVGHFSPEVAGAFQFQTAAEPDLLTAGCPCRMRLAGGGPSPNLPLATEGQSDGPATPYRRQSAWPHS